MNAHVASIARSAKLDERTTAFASDVVDGLSETPKRLSPKYFYDTAGSQLFEKITRLPEYYPTRTELGILRDHADDIAQLFPRGSALVEFGAGSTTKIRILLERCRFGAYVPVDISGDFLESEAAALRADFPDLPVHPVVADFTAPFALPSAVSGMTKVGFFPGSTIGNFDPHEASRFLANARSILGRGAWMILGADLEKDDAILQAAYNDAEGVTAQFDLNLLSRINRELGGNFDLSAFCHRAVYNRERHRVEMHLISRRPQKVRILGQTFAFRAGESIHTENSYKFSDLRLKALVEGAGWSIGSVWRDKAGLFSVSALRAA